MAPRKLFLFSLIGLVLLASYCVSVMAQEDPPEDAAQESSQSSGDDEEVAAKETQNANEEPQKQQKAQQANAQEEAAAVEQRGTEEDEDSDDDEKEVQPDPQCVKPLNYAFEGDCKEAGLESLSVADTEAGRAYLEEIDKNAVSKWQESADARHIVSIEKCKGPYVRHLCTSNVTLCQNQKKVKVCFSTCVELSMACYGLSLQNALRRCRSSGGYAPKGDENCLHEVKLNLRHIKWEDV